MLRLSQTLTGKWEGRDGFPRHFRGRINRTHRAVFDMGEGIQEKQKVFSSVTI